MMYHILNGDSLAHSFPAAAIDGTVVVFREALIDGNLEGNNLHEFWECRTRYMKLSDSDYRGKVVGEIEKILRAPEGSEINLWFEYDLFCQVNLWFVISVLGTLATRKNVYAVYTSHLDKTHRHFWNGFGPANADELRTCFHNRVHLDDGDLHFGQNLWETYRSRNLERLTDLAKNHSASFPYLQEVVKAHVDRFPLDGTPGRPERVMAEIIRTISTDVHEVCTEFWKRESIYGYGDVQLKRLYDNVMRKR